ncbi:DUF3078 domain-containing protein [Nonlabens ponticola]|uniref:DUF3078 domain-containing protein n=1 Tax=Nonlabens ponticola TaxID=2496866 RepID=A0A3S9MV45_9FLAO|nr:DUF3078 domain-containing protein [Nonlabens ponticola]AZQ43052.1 DUF3078 domain-containing protein [Nonlabens ponticola]
MKKLILLLFVITAVTAQAQDAEEQPQGWSNGGIFQLLFNQSAFNAEWQGGGTSSLAGNLGLNYDINYLMDRTSWDTKIIAEYGITRQDGDEFTRKTNDRLELNTVYGYKIAEDSAWSYSFFLNALTQFTKGYNFGEDEDGNVTRTERTNFLSPGYFQAGPGMLYKKGDNLSVNIAPATARLIVVDGQFTDGPDYVDGAYFGVDAGETTRFELGASINALYNFQIAENVRMDNVLLLYSNYLDKPGNIDINYSTNINMKINEWLSANLIFQAIYDDNAVGAFQIREVFGLGLNYKLGDAREVQ